MAAPPLSLKLTFVGVMAGEWLKLRKQRSFVWATWSALLVCVAVSALGGSLLKDDWSKDPVGAIGLAVTAPSSSVSIASLLFGLGLCVWLAGEYASGSNYLTLLAVPRRGLVFAARLGLVSALSLLFGAVTALIGTGAALLFVGPSLMWRIVSEGGFWASVSVTLVVCLSTALLYFAAATLTRRSLPAVGAMAVLFFVMPSIPAYMAFSHGPSVLSRILGSLPGSLASQALTGLSAEAAAPAYSSLTASALLMAWSALLVAGAAWLSAIRD